MERAGRYRQVQGAAQKASTETQFLRVYNWFSPIFKTQIS